MAQHDVTVSWSSDGNFRSGTYSRAHDWHFDGGAVVRGSSSPLVVPEPMSDPSGVDPEEALVASASSCHMLWFLALAQEAGFDVLSYRDDAAGTMGRDERGRISLARVTLRPAITYSGRAPRQEEAAALHDQAHERCFIANSLRGDVVVEQQPAT